MIDLPVAAWILLYLAQPLLLLLVLPLLPLPDTSDADPLRRMRVIIAAATLLPVPGAGLALTIIGLGLLAARRHRLLARSTALGDELTAAGTRPPVPHDPRRSRPGDGVPHRHGPLPPAPPPVRRLTGEPR